MGWHENALTADEWGLRVGDEGFPLRAFPWDAVTELRAYAVDEAFAVIEIQHEGEWEEALTTWKDFPLLAAGLAAHLPGLRPDWLESVQSLSAAAGPATVWDRKLAS